MTPRDSNTRLALYIAAAVLLESTASLAAFGEEVVSTRQWWIFGLKIAGAAVIAWRAYIDQSAGMVAKGPPRGRHPGSILPPPFAEPDPDLGPDKTKAPKD